nr:helix-turn-helix domain-containing protein [Duganella qianjiadongensis]
MKPNKRTTIATLLATGTSQREIARLTGVDRKTIRRLALGTTGQEPNSPALATGSATANSSTPATGANVEIPPPRPPANTGYSTAFIMTS